MLWRDVVAPALVFAGVLVIAYAALLVAAGV